MYQKFILGDRVAEAQSQAKPLVALESTIITHGMPWPQNLECALEVEALVREHGAVPATIAVIEGKLCVGLSEAELESLAQNKDALKLSQRDVPYAIARGESGGCTVAATLLAAERAGIEVFATGGIGGVHRGAGRTFDVSADLLALSRSRVAVVCAGPKAILDLALTLEKLESLNVAVFGYQTRQLPAFYYSDSGLPVASVQNVEEVAEFMRHNRELEACGGPLLCQPLPQEHALPKKDVEAAIERALLAAPQLEGKQVTPYLLQALVKESGGLSLAANMALIKNNARLAAELAVAI